MTDLEKLVEKMYPGLKRSGLCSAHRNDGHYDCGICYPNWKALTEHHSILHGETYEKLKVALAEIEQLKNAQS